MYVTQDVACTVPNSTTPIPAATLAASAASAAAQDAQAGGLLQNWITMIDRTPESFSDLNIVPAQFSQPQSATDLLNLDQTNTLASRLASYRAGPKCNPAADGPQVVPLNGFGDSLPINQVVDLMAKGPLGRPVANGMGAYRDLQPAVIAQRIAQRRMRRARVPRAGMGCNCGGSCAPCKSQNNGLGDALDVGSSVLWGSATAALFLLYVAFGDKPKRRR